MPPTGDRISRTGFALYLVVGLAAIFVMDWVLSLLWPGGSGMAGGLAAVLLLGGGGRLHDLGRSTWWGVVPLLALVVFLDSLRGGGPLILVLISGLISISGLLALLVLPGQPGGNRYGPPPGGRLRARPD